MSLNFESGVPIAYINGGKLNNKILYVDQKKEGVKDINLTKGKFEMLMNPKTREIIYIAGPSGVGKSTLARSLIEVYN